MNDFHPRIVRLSHSLSRCISAYGTDEVDVDEVMSWFSFDVMGDVVFSKDFNFMFEYFPTECGLSGCIQWKAMV